MPEMALHSPQEIVGLSNAAHIAEGILFAIIAVLTIARGSEVLSPARYRLLVPLTGLAASLTLVLFFFADHYDELPQAWRWITSDMQQRQHIYMAAILGAASLVALSGLAWRKNWFDVSMAIAFLAIGMVFLFHPQHGTGTEAARALAIHYGIGAGMILAVLIHAGATFIRGWRKALTVTAGFVLLAVAVLFMTYREPLMTAGDMTAGDAGMTSK